MAPRPNRARLNPKTDPLGGPQLTLAKLIIFSEHSLRIFALPLMVAFAFITLAWFGVFASLYPWAHLAALILFTLFFFKALGKAKHFWKAPSVSEAKRRVEEASHLKHRPLDVLEDRPALLGNDQMLLWQAHLEAAKEKTKKLYWPQWKLSFSDKDPYALRYALLIAFVIAAMSGWGVLGGRLIGAINPALGKLQILSPTLDAWITPPEYTHLPPVMIATPAGTRLDRAVIDVPEGSKITAHIAEQGGDVPTISIGEQKADFAVDDHSDYGVEQTISSGDKITIRRGWQQLGSWRIHVIPDQAPKISLIDPPSISERKSVRLSYEASDDYGVSEITAILSLRESLPGISAEPLEIALAKPDAKEVKRVSFEDLTSSPWAGLPVQIQLFATDMAGHKAESSIADFTLPERIFLNPVARALITERKKLLEKPQDDAVRNEAANVMAGIAQQTSSYRGDPIVLMALRSGAVRLILDRSPDVLTPVNSLLWQTAVRIEDGTIGLAEQALRAAQKDLGDALDRNASEQEIQQLIDRLHQALKQYLAELSTRMAARPGPIEDMSQLLGPQTNVLTPKDLDRMLENMRNLSATGAREAARKELSKLQQLLENMRTEHPQFSEAQKEAMRRLVALRELAKKQQLLMDKTFQNTSSNDKSAEHKLSAEQNDLLRQLKDLMGGAKGKEAENLTHGSDAMQAAGGDLDKSQNQGAVRHQNEALQALQAALQSMADDLRSSMLSLPMPGMGAMGEGNDPFGRNIGGLPNDDGSVKVPDQMEVRRVREILDELQRRAGDMNRPKPERDYIERLLQNF